jgi:hydroxymethylglutaryl-CoA reductase (NADPH)
LPLATTEAALVASYHRGSLLLTEAGGCSTLLLSEGLTRAPCFTFTSLADVGEFLIWASSQFDYFKKIAEGTTLHGKLLDIYTTVEGNHCYLNFEFSTGEAAGQNMVTIATEAVCQYIVESSPIKPKRMTIEGNLSGDKKASFLSFLGVRGKKVTAEALIPSRLIKKYLHTTVEDMQHQWQIGLLGGVMSGTVGAQSHYANALAALFIATGQDAACVAEAAVGITRLEKTTAGDLYTSVTMPNLIVGTIGGGTKLPSQAACARIIRIADSDHAKEFSEVCAALCLAGELSIIGAMCAGQFSRAHQKLARNGKKA